MEQVGHEDAQPLRFIAVHVEERRIDGTAHHRVNDRAFAEEAAGEKPAVLTGRARDDGDTGTHADFLEATRLTTIRAGKPNSKKAPLRAPFNTSLFADLTLRCSSASRR
jgi:hypothetical protein